MFEKRDQISNAISQLVEKINGFKGPASKEFHQILLNIENDFDNRRRKLDAKKYFVACFGALKAGKSTLMNALAERLVSPAGAGETTLRCSIILCTDKNHPEGITLYRRENKINEKEEDLEKHIQDLFLFFQGVMTATEIEKTFRSKYYTFDKLKYILTDPHLADLQEFRDFDIAEIRINVAPDSILNENVALIDMPGIDGALAGENKNKLLNFIPNQCQHLLWVQSSMSALNEKTYDTLDKFVKEKSETPIFSVLNKVMSKSRWFTPEAENEELNSSKIITKFNDSVFNINAAMAWDAYQFDKVKDRLQSNVNKERLLSDSGIAELKEALIKSIKNNGKTTILRDALKAIDNTNDNLNKSNHEIQNYRVVLENGKKTKWEEIYELDKNYRVLEQTIKVPGDSPEDKAYRAGFISEIESLYWNKYDLAAMDNLCNKIDSVTVRVELNCDGNVDKELQKKAIDECIRRIDEDIQRNITSTLCGNLKKFAEKKIRERCEVIQNYSKEITFESQKIDDLFKMQSPICSMQEWIDSRGIDIYDVSGTGFRKYGYRNSKELQKHMEKRLEEYRNFVKESMNSYLGNFAEKIDGLYGDYCQNVLKINKNKIDKQKSEKKVYINKAENEIEHIENILRDWRKIRDDSVKYLQELKN